MPNSLESIVVRDCSLGIRDYKDLFLPGRGFVDDVLFTTCWL